MTLSQAHRTLIAKARAIGSGKQGIALTDAMCAYLLAVVARDLGHTRQFPEFPADLPAFFERDAFHLQVVAVSDFDALFERLISLDTNADTYFSCLAALQKARLKYERILETQPIPTIDQVGPRGLLQFGTVAPRSLAAILLWRKWLFDVDNRAGQETGYIFEPIIAAAIGGFSVSAAKSPVRRMSDERKGRQVDCIRQIRRKKWAYEIKIRVTIAASGQGRWREELEFPADCRASRFVPVLVVLDPTENAKLDELKRAFLGVGGEVYIGQAAWDHFGGLAGATMGVFLEKYVHQPMQQLLEQMPVTSGELPELTLHMTAEHFTASVCADKLVIPRAVETEPPDDPDSLPDDVEDGAAGI